MVLLLEVLLKKVYETHDQSSQSVTYGWNPMRNNVIPLLLGAFWNPVKDSSGTLDHTLGPTDLKSLHRMVVAKLPHQSKKPTTFLFLL